MVVIFEDAHWIDATSRELLDIIVERVRDLKVLLIVTFRPEFQPPWAGQPRVTMLALNRLDRRDRIALVAQIAGKALPDAVIDQIADRTDGVPLFVEELTKSVLESGLLRAETDRYVHRWGVAAAGDPDEPVRLAAGAPRPPEVGAVGGADRRGDRTRVPLRRCCERYGLCPRTNYKRIKSFCGAKPTQKVQLDERGG